MTTAIFPSRICRLYWSQGRRKTILAERMPELPEARRKRMIAEYQITMQDAQTLTATREYADQFETAARQARSPRRVANLIQSELMGRLKAKSLDLEELSGHLAGVGAGSGSRGVWRAFQQAAQGALRHGI